MSFYRTYRPQIIDEIDNGAVQSALLRLLEKPVSSLPHAYLFHGPRGGGKTTSARIIAKIFNCTSLTKEGPCGRCDQCISIRDGKNLDIIEIDAASNRGIDEIRAIRDGIHLTPTQAKYKVYIIDEVHMLTTEAFNALLKTLEEPPSHAVFVLATTDPQKVPVTIKSRCVDVSFKKATVPELEKALEKIVHIEKLDIPKSSLTLIAQSVDGSFRDAVKALEQVSFHKGKVTKEVLENILSLSDEDVSAAFCTYLYERKAKDALDTVMKLTQEGKDIKTFLVSVIKNLQLLYIEQVKGSSSSSWDRSRVMHMICVLSDAFRNMKGSPIAELPIEIAIGLLSDSGKDQKKEEVKESGMTDAKLPADPVPPPVPQPQQNPQEETAGSLTLEYLTQHWSDVISELKPYNHSVAGVMRSTRPTSVARGIVTIEAFYTFHKERLSQAKTRDIIATVLKKLFGEKVKVDIVLGNK